MAESGMDLGDLCGEEGAAAKGREGCENGIVKEKGL